MKMKRIHTHSQNNAIQNDKHTQKAQEHFLPEWLNLEISTSCNRKIAINNCNVNQTNKQKRFRNKSDRVTISTNATKHRSMKA